MEFSPLQHCYYSYFDILNLGLKLRPPSKQVWLKPGLFWRLLLQRSPLQPSHKFFSLSPFFTLADPYWTESKLLGKEFKVLRLLSLRTLHGAKTDYFFVLILLQIPPFFCKKTRSRKQGHRLSHHMTFPFEAKPLELARHEKSTTGQYGALRLLS